MRFVLDANAEAGKAEGHYDQAKYCWVQPDLRGKDAAVALEAPANVLTNWSVSEEREKRGGSMEPTTSRNLAAEASPFMQPIRNSLFDSPHAHGDQP